MMQYINTWADTSNTTNIWRDNDIKTQYVSLMQQLPDAMQILNNCQSKYNCTITT